MPEHPQLIDLCGPYDGSRLIEAFYNNELEGYFNNEPAVYLWLRRLSPTGSQIATQETFLDWINAELKRPQGVVVDNLLHMGTMTFAVGGADLGTRKLEALSKIAETRMERQRIQTLLRAFDYTVALYVGESESLLGRMREHLSGRTDFAERMSTSGYTWESVGVKYVAVPEYTIAQRRALERSLSILMLAPATSRAG